MRETIPWEDFNTAHGILDCLENAGPLSRAAVAKRLGLSRTTLTNIITPLMDRGLVAETNGQADPQGRGRPGIPVDLDTGSWFALGAVYYSGRWIFAVTTLKGEVVCSRTFAVSSGSPRGFLSSLVRGIAAMRKAAPGELLPGVGIGVPGLVNWETGSIIRADDLGWERIDVRGAVKDAAGLAPYVVNRNRAAGIAEAKYGAGRNVPNFIYIGIGTGISAAIMIRGELLHGASYSAGEIGHLIIDPDGPPCRCGKRGCLQTMAAEDALSACAGGLFRSGRIPPDSPLGSVFAAGGEITGAAVCRAAQQGDAAARCCLREAAKHIGRAAGALITALNPGKIILGGPLVREGRIFAEYVREEAAHWAMAHPYSSVSVEASSLDEFAGARGAACLVLRNKLELIDTIKE